MRLTRPAIQSQIAETETKLAKYRGLATLDELEMPIILQVTGQQEKQVLFSIRIPEEVLLSIMSLAEVEQTPALMRLSEYHTVTYQGESLAEMAQEIRSFQELRSKEPLASVIIIWADIADYCLQEELSLHCLPN